MSECGGITNVCGFVGGWKFSHDGSLQGFKQSTANDTVTPSFMVGEPVIVVPKALGKFKYRDAGLPDSALADLADPFSDAYYAGSGGDYSGNPFQNGPSLADATRQVDRGIIPRTMQEVDSSGNIKQQILASPEFQAHYSQAMRALGGIPVFLREEDDDQQDASEAVPSFSKDQDIFKPSWGAAAD